MYLGTYKTFYATCGTHVKVHTLLHRNAKSLGDTSLPVGSFELVTLAAEARGLPPDQTQANLEDIESQSSRYRKVNLRLPRANCARKVVKIRYEHMRVGVQFMNKNG